MSVVTAEIRIPRTALVLGIAGIVPFLPTLALSWSVPSPGYEALGRLAALAYAALLLSFLGGIRWGYALGPIAPRRAAREFALSAAAPLAGWLALLLPPAVSLCALLCAFLIQALWDVMAVDAGRLPYWYGKLRMMITAGACVALVAVLAGIVFR